MRHVETEIFKLLKDTDTSQDEGIAGMMMALIMTCRVMGLSKKESLWAISECWDAAEKQSRKGLWP
jgi:hypothetical protein